MFRMLRGVERQRDHQGSGYQCVHGLPVRKQLVEEGFAAVLSRKQRTMPAVSSDLLSAHICYTLKSESIGDYDRSF